MWTREGGLIQVVLGTELERVATASSMADIFRAGLEPESLQQLAAGGAGAPGGLLVTATDQLRRQANAAGYTMPPVMYRVNESLPPSGMYLYMGIEQFWQYASTIDEIIDALSQQVRRYGETSHSVHDSRLEAVLQHATAVVNSEPSEALNEAEFVYYHAELRDSTVLSTVALAIAGQAHLGLHSRSYAIELLTAAHKTVRECDLARWLLPELTLTCAEALGQEGEWARASAGYEVALFEAHSAQDARNCLLALMGLAQSRSALGDTAGALEAMQIIQSVLGQSGVGGEVRDEVSEVVQVTAQTKGSTRVSLVGRMRERAMTALVTSTTVLGMVAYVSISKPTYDQRGAHLENAQVGDKNSFTA